MNPHKPGWTSRWHSTSFRVRYEETDQMGVVYHANYLIWFESGRTEMFRELGFAYRTLEGHGLLLPVTSADLQFKSPARYDDLITVYARLTTFTALRVVYEYEVRRHPAGCEGQDRAAGELLVSGSTSHVWLNREWRPVRIDRAQPELFHSIVNALGEEEGGAV